MAERSTCQPARSSASGSSLRAMVLPGISATGGRPALSGSPVMRGSSRPLTSRASSAALGAICATPASLAGSESRVAGPVQNTRMPRSTAPTAAFSSAATPTCCAQCCQVRGEVINRITWAPLDCRKPVIRWAGAESSAARTSSQGSIVEARPKRSSAMASRSLPSGRMSRRGRTVMGAPEAVRRHFPQAPGRRRSGHPGAGRWCGRHGHGRRPCDR
ncbi:hypothetical protein MAJHIDBO_02222 [Propionibacterium freudenreichii subsp. shermanii]|nr:hypothetical protein MAJHIDBO_02222 [Propionibacterium freudenreichii subsp. shermanii]SPS10003.1 hypothetical protein MAJHIDBO_02222 [Propionibacterium freudenreichii subsp. shermanii]